MTYPVKMARAAAPAIDRATRRLHDGGYEHVMSAARFNYQPTQFHAVFASTADMEVAGSVLAEELRADGWGWTAIYDNGNARTGNQVGLTATHPRFVTQMGDEVRQRPDSWGVTGPMPGRNVYLDAETIERIAQEAAEVVRDTLRQQAIKEYGQVPEGTFDLPKTEGNPLETQFHRDAAAHNDEPVDAPKPRPLSEVFMPDEDAES
jgi:hypothetical protein